MKDSFFSFSADCNLKKKMLFYLILQLTELNSNVLLSRCRVWVSMQPNRSGMWPLLNCSLRTEWTIWVASSQAIAATSRVPVWYRNGFHSTDTFFVIYSHQNASWSSTNPDDICLWSITTNQKMNSWESDSRPNILCPLISVCDVDGSFCHSLWIECYVYMTALSCSNIMIYQMI